MNILKRVLYTSGLIKDPVYVAHIVDYEKSRESKPSLSSMFGGDTGERNDPYMPYNPFNASDYKWFNYGD